MDPLNKLREVLNSEEISGGDFSSVKKALYENNSIFDDETKSVLDQIDEYTGNKWLELQYTADWCPFWTQTYTYKTANGSTIVITNPNNSVIKQNCETGEIVIIGATDAKITMNENDNELTVLESTVTEINAKKDDATINVAGTHTSVSKINGGKGDQTIVITNGAYVDSIDTGKDDDNVLISNGTVGRIKTGDGNDSIIGYNATINDTIDTAKDKDVIIFDSSEINKEVETGSGNDRIVIENSTLNSTLDAGNDNDRIIINNSELNADSYSSRLIVGNGDDELEINNSQINMNVDISNGNNTTRINESSLDRQNQIVSVSGNNNLSIKNSHLYGEINNYSPEFDFNLYLENTTVKDVTGIGYHDGSNITTVNSTVRGFNNLSNANREVISLDTSQGSEFEGFSLLQRASNETRKVYLITYSDGKKRVMTEEEYRNNYSLPMSIVEYEQISYSAPNGATIWLDNDGGQVYYNSSTGEIVLNSANNAYISAAYNQKSKITTINSNINNYTGHNSELECRDCIINDIDIVEGQNTQITLKSSNVSNINSYNSTISINCSDGTNIDNIYANNSGTVTFNGKNTNIGYITATGIANLAINIDETNTKTDIYEISSQNGNITGNLGNAKITTIETTGGSINLSANGAKIKEMINKSESGSTKIDFNFTTIEKFNTKNASYVNLNSCNVTKLTTSKYSDIINANNSEIDTINAGDGQDTINIKGGSVDTVQTNGIQNNVSLNGTEVDKLTAYGNNTILYSDVDTANLFGNIAVSASEINSLNTNKYIASNVYIEDSIIGNNINNGIDNIYRNNFGSVTTQNSGEKALNPSQNNALSKLNELRENEAQELCELIKYFDEEGYNFTFENNGEKLSYEKTLELLSNNPTAIMESIKSQLIAYMEGSLLTIEHAIEDDEATLGLFGGIAYYLFNTDKSKLEEKRNILSSAVKNGDMKSILNAYKLLTDEIATANEIKTQQEAIVYAATLDSETVNDLFTVLDYIGNLMEYTLTEQDGVIKSIISYANIKYDIGTNKNEALAYINTFREDVENLRTRYNNGELSPEEFAAEYKRITGNNLTEENLDTLLDDIRNNDEFKNLAQCKIEDYQQTQQTIFQIGEYTIVILAGTAVTVMSGGAAGPEVAAALAGLGKLGIALTATTVSFVVKTAIEVTERDTNQIIADDVTKDEIIKSAALMYAGCLSGQLGGLVNEYVQGLSMQWIEDVALSKILGLAADLTVDSLVCYATTGLINGDSEFTEEFMMNLQQQLIGLIQSKFVQAYFYAHPEISIKTDIYNKQKMYEAQGFTTEQANQKILISLGFTEAEAIKITTEGTPQQVETIIIAKTVEADQVAREEYTKLTDEEVSSKPVDTEAGDTPKSSSYSLVYRKDGQTFIIDPVTKQELPVTAEINNADGSTTYKYSQDGYECEYDGKIVSRYKMQGKPGQEKLTLDSQIIPDEEGNTLYIRKKIKFKNGEMTCKVYDNNNKLLSQDTYSEDGTSLLQRVEYNENNVPTCKKTYTDGECTLKENYDIDGNTVKSKEYYENGIRRKIEIINAKKEVSSTIFYDSTGKNIESIKYGDTEYKFKDGKIIVGGKALDVTIKDKSLSINGFDSNIQIKQNDLGQFVLKLSDEYIQATRQQYGDDFAEKLIQYAQKPIETKDLQKLTNLFNVADGSYKSYWNSHPEELIAYFNVLNQADGKMGILDYFDSITNEQWSAVMSVIKNKPSSEVIDILSFYKYQGDEQINRALSMIEEAGGIENANVSPILLKKIDLLTAYIASNQLEQPMHVYRGEGYAVFDSVIMENGQKLSEVMAAANGNPDEIARIISEVTRYQYTAHQERFMSTSLVQEKAFQDKSVIWDLELPAGTRGIFIDGSTYTEKYNFECEYLIQRGSDIKITDIDYDYSTGKWVVHGQIIQN